MDKIIYKICSKDEWASALAAKTYSGSPDDIGDGFIHFSTAGQLAGTLAKHFSGRDDLLLIGFKAEAFGNQLKWETSRGGALFPHFYGVLDTGLALKTVELLVQSGIHVLPDLDDLR